MTDTELKPAEATPPAPPADTADAWLAELAAALDALFVGTAKRLAELATSAPSGQASIAAMTTLAGRADWRAGMPVNFALIRERLFDAAKTAAENAARQLRDVFVATTNNAKTALAAGHNDSTDPFVSLRGFRVVREHDAASRGFLAASAAAPGSPLATLQPVTTGNYSSPVYVVPAAIIGLAEAPFDLVPLSAIRRLTDAERTRRAAELAAIKRDEELAAAAAREAWRMSADGQRERVRALEAEMAALRAGSAPPQPIPATEGA